MRKLLIIGGSGFVGRSLIKHLSDTYDITSVSKVSRVDGVHNKLIDLNKTNFSFTKDYDYIVYLGTTSSPKEAERKPNESFKTNVENIHRFLEASRKYMPKKIILLSSAVLYSSDNKSFSEEDKIDPFISIYNFSKYNLELLATFYREKYELPVTVFRLSNTYGPGQLNNRAPYLIPGLFDQAIKVGRMKIWNITPIRDWVYVDDVAEIIGKELEMESGGLFNLGTGKGSSVEQIAEIIKKLTGAEYINLNRPVSPPYKIVCDVRKLKKRLGYIPMVGIDEGLKESYRYYKTI